ncbi:MAG: FHA domain-containing protein [Chthoniobacteraceae bacterium]|nr:FHA domain-containing protein [Chthoniobacteraceae bacterium]
MEEQDKTRIIRRPSAQPPPPPIPSRQAEPSLPENPDKTRILPRRPEDLPAQEGAAKRPAQPAEDDKTVILTPPSRERATGEAPLDDAMIDPIVGWLVVVAGPGRGHALQLGHGMNSIGRAEGQRCKLDFGDTEISRKIHATLTYDPRGRKFYLMHGGGQNLTYIGETPVLAPVVLNGGELISLGKTTLKFIPLCGPDFDWSKKMD